MNLAEFENLTVSQLEHLDIDQLKEIASKQGQKLNKRLDRITSSSKTNKSAAREVKKSGGRFGVGGLTIRNKNGDINISATKQNLISEIKREQNFQKAKTGTFAGAKKVQEESAKKVFISSGKDYEKQKAKEWREEQKGKMGKRKWRKMSKKDKSKFYRESRKAGQKARKEEYDKRLSDAWEKFHRWKETHPASAQSYSKDKVKSIVNEYAVEVGQGPDYDGMILVRQEDDIMPDVWSTVDKDNPFDVKDTPEQFTLRNGRIV